ncbi:hypothetical protein [Achromobacter piechaudii]|uniref:Uncharacterized protein n=1 Tax=Achromobacter piechaudii TaxID=72556 RepID=A0A6S7DY25_9BURK|nr:hypothetical protein [Achromobacter piechaudii]CAB3864317.1 hypothetical protein LMG1861_02426 [Achromobacter piechaudii]
MNLFLFGFPIVMTVAVIVHACLRPRPGDTTRKLALRVLAGGLLYGAIGPALGLAVVPLTLTIPDSLQNITGLQVAYLIGGIPALMCGMTAGALKRVPFDWSVPAAVCGAGALYGYVFMLPIVGVDRIRSWTEALQIGALPGLAAAALCSIPFLRMGAKKTTTPS